MAIDWTRWDDDPYWTQGWWDWRPPWIHPSKPATVRWAAARTIDPVLEPVSLEEAKLHLRVDSQDDDSLILNLISAAREYVESQYSLSLMTQTWRLGLDNWPRQDRLEKWPTPALPLGSILLPRAPVQSVTSIVWYGADGSNNTVPSTTYITDFISRPARIALAPLTSGGSGPQSWPSAGLTSLMGVAVNFVAGYTAPELVPRYFKQALLLIIGHWYENREEIVVDRQVKVLEIPFGARDLLDRTLPPLVG